MIVPPTYVSCRAYGELSAAGRRRAIHLLREELPHILERQCIAARVEREHRRLRVRPLPENKGPGFRRAPFLHARGSEIAHPAVDDQLAAGCEARFVRREMDERAGDLARLAEAAGRRLREDRLLSARKLRFVGPSLP